MNCKTCNRRLNSNTDLTNVINKICEDCKCCFYNGEYELVVTDEVDDTDRNVLVCDTPSTINECLQFECLEAEVAREWHASFTSFNCTNCTDETVMLILNPSRPDKCYIITI